MQILFNWKIEFDPIKLNRLRSSGENTKLPVRMKKRNKMEKKKEVTTKNI